MASAESIARYVLWLSEQEPERAFITQMHLHKLLYYVQGWALGIGGQPVIDDSFEAWVHGPVVRRLRPVFANYGDSAIASSEARDPEELDEPTRELVRMVWLEYRKYTASQLRRMTHSEPPWQEARGGIPDEDPCSTVLSIESMKAYFEKLTKERLVGGITPEELRQAESRFDPNTAIRFSDVKDRWSNAV